MGQLEVKLQQAVVNWHRFTPSNFEYDFDQGEYRPCLMANAVSLAICSPKARGVLRATLPHFKLIRRFV